MNLQKEDVIKRLKLSEHAGEQGCSTNRQTIDAYGNHWHDFYEIEVIVEGEGTYWYNGAEQTRRKGDITLLTPADFHMMKGKGKFTVINVEVGAQWLSPKMHKMMCAPDFMKFRHLSDREFTQFCAAIELLEQEYESNGPCIGALLEYIFSRFAHNKQQSTADDAGKECASGIMCAVSYMEQHFREKITLEMLSQVSGYHPTYFSKMFRKVTGENYIDRLTTLRVNYAKMLLKREIPVSDVCFASGFGSLSNFSAVFKKRCGMSPMEYRICHQDDKKTTKN
ncbi:MAG: AraC family transcriptional regulator [Oscillospiraceae bacterium]|nr:AraC family transcriptional regulator [Oscillospiraceae bacterium]